MKIGILTFHDTANYGALLQAYALQETLTALGTQSEFVSIKRKEREPVTANSVLAKRIETMNKQRDDLFAVFRRQYLNISELFNPGDHIDDKYDIFIAGSDQVWNTSIPYVDSRYFLPFASPEKRYSYAAGFGEGKFTENTREWIADQLKQFHEISVREEAGRTIVKELTGRDSIVCVDPVLLPPKEKWEAIISKQDRAPYLLLFLLQYDASFVQTAKAEAVKRGLEPVVVTAGYMPQLGFDAWVKTSVTDWLSLVANAACVFTDSFHATAVCLIFQKEFCVKPLGGELQNRNSRISELLSLIFPERIQTTGVMLDASEVPVRERLSERTDNSIHYLKTIVNNTAV